MLSAKASYVMLSVKASYVILLAKTSYVMLPAKGTKFHVHDVFSILLGWNGKSMELGLFSRQYLCKVLGNINDL